jgi:putative transcriptional regulator
MKSFENNDKLRLENRLKLARVERNLTQGDLAKMSGVSRQTIGAIESGKFNPTAKLALIFCILLEKKFEELFYFELQ